jgi:ankyrin repeat protein
MAQSIFGYIARRDIESVQRLLRTGSASVLDVVGDTRKPILSAAFESRHIEMIRILLQEGSDPFQESHDGEYPIRDAFMNFISGTAFRRELERLLPFSTFSTFMEREGYYKLHRAAAGYLPLRLPELLQEDPEFQAEVNSVERRGHTPLHLATIRGDVSVVAALLLAGADRGLSTVLGRAPVHSACAHGHIDVVRLLLEYASSTVTVVNCRDGYGWTPPHYAMSCRSGSDEKNRRLVALLVRNGADITAVENSGATPLAAGSEAGRAESVEYLLRQGAPLSSRCNEGNTPLLLAIQSMVARVAMVLLAAGAGYTIANNHGHTVLHDLAATGDENMLGIFTRVDMRGLDSKRKNNSGDTPQAIFDRLYDSKELRKVFDKLIESTESEDCTGYCEEWSGQTDGNVSDDEFFDFPETLGLE